MENSACQNILIWLEETRKHHHHLVKARNSLLEDENIKLREKVKSLQETIEFKNQMYEAIYNGWGD